MERFSTSSELAKHNAKVHSAELPYICIECYERGDEKRFQKKRELELHSQSSEHTDLCNTENKYKLQKSGSFEKSESKSVTPKGSIEEKTETALQKTPSTDKTESLEHKSNLSENREPEQRRASILGKPEDMSKSSNAEVTFIAPNDVTNQKTVNNDVKQREKTKRK